MTLNHRGLSSNLSEWTIWGYSVNGLAQQTFNLPGQGSNPCAPTTEYRTFINKCMYYLIYKISNKLNGKFYIGCHKTKNKDDGYMGSGVALKKAYDKYGIENFSKEIIFECSSKEEMFEMESQLVEIGPHTYNLMEGGYGGFSHIVEQGKNKNYDWSDYRKSDGFSDSQRKGYENGIGKDGFVKPKFRGDEFKGKTHSDETKSKIGKKNSKHQSGSGNSQFGKMWITNGKENLKINKTDDIPEGYHKGRVIKNVI
jgi:hypothetical protein